MNLIDAPVARLGFWTVLVCSVFAWAPATYPGYWQSLEGFVPVFNVAQTSALARVATAPDLWRGTGSAAFLPAQPLLLLGASPIVAVRAIFVISFLLGGLSIYVWLRPRLGDRAAGLAGVLYMLLPPFLATVYVRGSVSDALLLGLLPLALAAASSYAESRAPSAAGILVLCLLWMWRTQAGLAVFASVALLAYVWFVERSNLTVLVVAVAAAAGLVSLVPHWATTASAPAPFADHLLSLGQLLTGDWPAHAAATPGWGSYPALLGFAVLALGVVAVWLWRTQAATWRTTPQARLLGFATVCSLVLLALTLSASAPLWRASGAQRLLSYPWQIVLVAAPFLVAVAGSLPAFSPALSRAPLWTVLVAVGVLSSYPYLGAAYTQVAPPPAPIAVFGRDNDLVVLAADLTERPAAGTATLDVTWQVLRPLPFDYNVFFQAVTAGADGERVLGQLDTQPLTDAQPATTWPPGAILQARYRLRFDPATRPMPDNVRYYFGYYDWRDGVRLPIDGGIDDKLILYGD